MNLVIVDDQSSQIKYTGLWTNGASSRSYSHTASASRVVGATMTFPFSGTSVSVVGSYDANTTCTGSFAIDSNVTTFSSPTLSAPLDHQSIWTSAPLPDANHTLTYTLSSCTSSSSNDTPGNVWFDYILYTPSSNASTNGFIYFVDDSDSSIDYSGNWTVETNNDENFGHTGHGGTQGCSFQLDFEGTSVSVYGRVGNDSTNSASQMSFTLDGTSPVVYSAPYQSAVSYNMPLFQSEALEQGKHSLVAASQSGMVWVDYLLVQPDPSTNITLAATEHSSVNVIEFAGIGVGVLVLAVAIALLVIFRRRLFKGRRPTPSRPLTRPPNFHVFSPEKPRHQTHSFAIYEHLPAYSLFP
ncbi:hypothetical protein B0H13DRAFT_1133946 [Mycena leptocephala]|nr:hypothetical protein B0H13DRAFT_1133946 [Mycena leptocephala]